ncbi:hypothetical protein [Actibacterium sp. XHP0104]|uniref:hypothetical protein n=1 Tax=Actibacterium sp. XHP0104 TaxID=2984335 RepID=UPI0021E88FA3|nr:hypothetical protein [Actibacterium sp. XHP0104]MCV2881939.1 hypothetical protein [Actibacterium sp. XHP0104]
MGGTPISDYSDRSVVYGWVDLSQAAGNKVVGGTIRAYNMPADKNLYPSGYMKFGEGYIFYHVGIAPGPIKLNTLSTMTCVGLCGNVVNVYDFGAQGSDVAAANVRGKGVYYLGSYALKTRRGLFFAPRDFTVSRANGPSRRQMLEAILKEAPDQQKPLIQQAINRL